MSDTDPKVLQTGTYIVDAACPRCGAIEEMLVRLSSVVTIPEDDLGSLRVKLKGKPRDHDCRQNRLFTVQAAGTEAGDPS